MNIIICNKILEYLDMLHKELGCNDYYRELLENAGASIDNIKEQLEYEIKKKS